MHSEYQSSIIRELRDQQVRFAPRAKKLEQIERAERLLSELDPGKTYSYEYLCFRITDYRPDPSKSLLSGAEARHDVRLFVEDVSDAANVRVEDIPEPVHTVEALSKLFNVSTKTITRWREQGLVSRRFIFDGGRVEIDGKILEPIIKAASLLVRIGHRGMDGVQHVEKSTARLDERLIADVRRGLVLQLEPQVGAIVPDRRHQRGEVGVEGEIVDTGSVAPERRRCLVRAFAVFRQRCQRSQHQARGIVDRKVSVVRLRLRRPTRVLQ